MLHLNKKFFCFLFVSVYLTLDGSFQNKSLINKKFGASTASVPGYLFEQRLVSKVYNIFITKFLGNEPASEEYQKLGKEAQDVLDVPTVYQVPLKKLPAALTNLQIAAFAIPGGIYVNEERLKSEAYGSKRCALFHEAVHIKYNDNSVNVLIDFGALCGIAFVGNKLLSKAINANRLIRYPLATIVAFGVTCVAANAYGKYMERRADIEGHYATQCFSCVQEAAVRRFESFNQANNPLKNEGYLWANDLKIIAAELQGANKMCLHHIAKLIN